LELRPAPRLLRQPIYSGPGPYGRRSPRFCVTPCGRCAQKAIASWALGANVLNSLSLSALAGDAVAIAIELCEVTGRILGDVTYAVCLGLAAVVVWTSSTSYWS
jgi:hypothetical protein